MCNLSLQTLSTMKKDATGCGFGCSLGPGTSSTGRHTYFLNHRISSGSEMPNSLIFFTMAALFLTATS